MPFFDPLPEQPPSPPPAPPHRLPAWMGPSEDELPGVVAIELPLVHTADQLMWIGSAEVYAEGVAFSVLMCGQRSASEGVESGPGTWRFGVEFSDGARATTHGVGIGARLGLTATTVGAVAMPTGQPQPPAAPVLIARGGGGSRSSWRQNYWLWPLPPPGDLLFACEWPDLQIGFTTASVDVDPILQAARRARPMWPGRTQSHLGATPT